MGRAGGGGRDEEHGEGWGSEEGVGEGRKGGGMGRGSGEGWRACMSAHCTIPTDLLPFAHESV